MKIIISSLREAADESGLIFSPNWVTITPLLATTEQQQHNHNTTTAATTAEPELTEKDEEAGGSMIHSAALSAWRDSGFQEDLTAAWATRAAYDAEALPMLLPESFQNSSFLIRCRIIIGDE